MLPGHVQAELDLCTIPEDHKAVGSSHKILRVGGFRSASTSLVKEDYKSIVSKFDLSTVKSAWMSGFLDGHYLEALFTETDFLLKPTELILAIPDLYNLKMFMYERDLTNIFRHKNHLRILVGDDENLSSNFVNTCTGHERVDLIPHVMFFDYLRYTRRFPIHLDTYSVLVERNTVSAEAGKKEVLGNYDRNKSTALSGPSVNTYEGSCAGKSASLVAAGPSMDDTRIMIDRRTDIFAAGQILSTLVKHNIKPGNVVYVDRSAVSEGHFPEAYKSSKWADDVNFYYNLETYSEVVKLHRNKIFMYNNKFVIPCKEVDDKFLGLSSVEHGSGISSYMIGLAVYLGYTTIYMYGMDLGFYTREKIHAEGYMIDFSNHFSTVETVSSHGMLGPIMSDYHMEAEVRWIESFIVRNPGVKFINMSKGRIINGAVNYFAKEIFNV